MRINKLYIILIAAFVVCATSCDDFLNIQPKGILIPKTVAEYESLLNSSAVTAGPDCYPAYITDDAFIPDLAHESGTPGIKTLSTENRNLYTFQPTVFSESEDDYIWSDSYHRLYYYNTIESSILHATEGTQQEKESIRGEALTGRAFEYLTLVNLYAVHYDPKTAPTDAGVPIILDADIWKKNLTRASVQEVYNQIVKDLTDAEKVLPEIPRLNAFRASKAAAWGLLARTYLYMGNYSEALKYANKVLAKTNVLLDLKKYKVTNPQGANGRINVPVHRYNPENIYIRMDRSTFGLSGYIFASDNLLSYYTEKDKRFLLYLSDNPWEMPNDYYLWIPSIETNLGVFTPDLYLIAAECEARIGSPEKAMQLINTLRDNRIIGNTPLVATSNEDALVKVLDERRRELAFMGCSRLFDLKRLNKDPRFAKTVTRTVEKKTLNLPPNSPLYVLPIPHKVLRMNPDMKPNKR